MLSVPSVLATDVDGTISSIEQYIRKIAKAHQARGVLIGLSGGLDSVVLSTLAVQALGKHYVRVAYLCGRDSGKASQDRARLATNWLGLELEVYNIEPAMRQRGIYNLFFMRVASLSGLLNRVVMRCYELVFRESAWISVLRRDQFEGHRFKQWVCKCGVRHVEVAFNARHVYRREILEKMAKDRGLVLLSAANRSEFAVGWFVSGGIDDLPFSPLMSLYKTQIRELAAHVGIPAEILDQEPSPDMLKGITDQAALGLPYPKIDLILDGMDRGLSDGEMMSAGVTKKEINYGRQMRELSAWKRQPERIRGS